MTAANYIFDWTDVAFGDKKPIKALKAIFIAAPREISQARFKQLIKTYLPQGNIVLGLSREPYVAGFEGQPQFRMLQASAMQKIIDRVNSAASPHKIYTLHYFQRELPFLLEKLVFKKALFVNGSWRYAFHVSPAYYILASKQLPYQLISPFTDEAEAKRYEQTTLAEIARLDSEMAFPGAYSDAELLAIAQKSATRSFDYGFQTGLALGEPMPGEPGKYRLLVATYNKVVPFQTYALLHGASREVHFSPPNDLNHYDTVHAETCLLIEAQKAGHNLAGTTLFINLLPCPPCARMLSQTDINEFVYSIDHSDGYAVKMLEAAGKKVRRIVL